jgi:beta-lactamase superfamily II metal-dependent hydrolase
MIPTFTFFAVEKGNMTLVEFDNGINMLVDCHQAEGRPTPLQYLVDRIKKLDILVISHPHRDHLTGLSELCEHFEPMHMWHCGRYFMPDPVFDDWSYYERMRKGELSFCSPTEVHSGMTFRIGLSEVAVLGPKQPFLEGTPDDVNNNGIILCITTGNSKLVVTGDTQTEQWDIIDSSRLVGTSVFLASHHGRENGFSERIMKMMRPQRIIISDGEPADTDATAKYEKFAPVSTTRKHSIVVSAVRTAASVG